MNELKYMFWIVSFILLVISCVWGKMSELAFMLCDWEWYAIGIVTIVLLWGIWSHLLERKSL